MESARCKRLEKTCRHLDDSESPRSDDKRQSNTQIVVPLEFICIRPQLITQEGRKYIFGTACDVFCESFANL